MKHCLSSFALLALLCALPSRAQTPPWGLDQRPSNTTFIAPTRPAGAAGISAREAFATAPSFSGPVKLLQAPGDGSRWFVLEKTGRIKVLPVANPATTSVWLDLTGLV